MSICKLGSEKLASEIIKQLEDVEKLKRCNSYLFDVIQVHKKRLDACHKTSPYNKEDFFCMHCFLCFNKKLLSTRFKIDPYTGIGVCKFCCEEQQLMTKSCKK